MSLVPAISDEFDSVTGAYTNYKTLPGERPPVATPSTNSFAPVPTMMNHVLVNKHIDLRSFREKSIIVNRTASDLSAYHQLENAYQQVLSVPTTPTSGTFVLTWVDIDGNDHTHTLNYNATAPQVQAALEDFVGVGKVTVTQPIITTWPFSITFDADVEYLVKLKASSSLLDTATPVPVTVSLVGIDSLFLQTADPDDPTFTQDQLQYTTLNQGEQWGLDPRSIGLSQADITVGFLQDYGNYSGMQINLRDVDPLDAIIVSRGINRPTDLLALNGNRTIDTFISMALPNFPSILDLTQTYIQFTSDPLGRFADEGGAGTDTNKVYFNSHLNTYTGGKEFRAALSEFDASANLRRITGVRIRVYDTGGGLIGQRLTFMALRAVDLNWFPLTMDINTREGGLAASPPLSGNPSMAQEIFPTLLRHATGETSSADIADPLPSDITLSARFTTGNLSATNKIQLYLRENEIDDNTTEFLVAELEFGFNAITLRRYKINRQFDGGFYQDTNVFMTTDVKNGPAIAPGVLAPLAIGTNYLFQAEVLSTGFRVSVYELDSGGATVRTHYDAGMQFNNAWNVVNGRIGWGFDIREGDILIDYVRSGSLIFSVLRTAVFHTKTPVVGAQLFVEAAPNDDVFLGMQSLQVSDAVVLDPQKSQTDSTASWRFSSGSTTPDNSVNGMRSNQIDISDWSQTDIEFDIWMSPGMASDPNKRPAIYFKQPGAAPNLGVGTGTIGPLPINIIPNVWTHNTLNLGFYSRLPVGSYELWIASLTPTRETWWLDKMHVYQRAVEWEMRAQEGAQWVSFGEIVNRIDGALHLSREQMGQSLQLQAKALTPSAWVASYTLVPIFAKLGRVIAQPPNVEPATVDSYIGYPNTYTYGSAIISHAEQFAPFNQTGTVTGLAVIGSDEEPFHA